MKNIVLVDIHFSFLFLLCLNYKFSRKCVTAVGLYLAGGLDWYWRSDFWTSCSSFSWTGKQLGTDGNQSRPQCDWYAESMTSALLLTLYAFWTILKAKLHYRLALRQQAVADALSVADEFRRPESKVRMNVTDACVGERITPNLDDCCLFEIIC